MRQMRFGYPLYGAAFLYNVSLHMTLLLIPLYMYSLGFSLPAIGAVVSVPGFVQLIFRLLAGAICDRIGEKRALVLSCATVALVAYGLTGTVSYPGLVVVHLLIGVSRSFFWPSTQAYASRVDPARAAYILGWLASAVGIGTMVGPAVGGLLAAARGFQFAFAFSLAVGGAALLFALFLPYLGGKDVLASVREMAVSMAVMLKVRPFYAGAAVSVVAAVPYALMGSYYPLYLETLGLSQETIGALNSVMSTGYVGMAFIFGVMEGRVGPAIMCAVSLLGIGAALVMSAFWPAFLLLLPLMVMLGASSGLCDVLSQLIASRHSPPGQRASALALTGYGWPLAYVLIPITFGPAIEKVGFSSVFAVAGCIFLVAALTSGWILRWVGVTRLEQ